MARPRAAHHARHRVREGQQEVEQRNRARLQRTEGDDLRIAVNSEISHGASRLIPTPTTSAIIRLHRMPKRAPRRARSYCFAPRFWPMKVASAKAKLLMGRKPNPSILE